MKLRKVLAIALAAALLVLTLPNVVFFAETTTYNVSTADEFVAALDEINASTAEGVSYIVNVTDNITLSSKWYVKKDITLITGDNAITSAYSSNSFVSVSGGKLTLGTATDKCTIIGNSDAGDGGVLIYVGNAGAGGELVLNAGATIKDNNVTNYFGGAVIVQGPGSMTMNGGTIDNCGISSGQPATAAVLQYLAAVHLQ